MTVSVALMVEGTSDCCTQLKRLDRLEQSVHRSCASLGALTIQTLERHRREYQRCFPNRRIRLPSRKQRHPWTFGNTHSKSFRQSPMR
jgi:hypothetical protein